VRLLHLTLNVACFFYAQATFSDRKRGAVVLPETGISSARVVYGLEVADDDDRVPVAVVPLLIVRVSNRTSTRRF